MPTSTSNSTANRGDTGGSSLVAVLLTWFIPGAGHVYLGRLGFAAAAFVVVTGLYMLGFALSDGLVFEFLDPELRGATAVALAPEVGNLGALLWHLRAQPLVALPFQPKPFPSAIAIGAILTAASGVLNVLLMSQAHWDARGKARQSAALSKSPALDALCAWVLPGLGHFRQKRTLRGVVVFCLLVGLFALGTWFAAGSNLSRERHFYYWTGQFLLGLPAIGAELASGHPPLTADHKLGDVGLYLACLAGLLNVLAVLDVYGWREASEQGLDPVADRRARDDDESKSTAAAGAKEAPRKSKHLVGSDSLSTDDVQPGAGT